MLRCCDEVVVPARLKAPIGKNEAATPLIAPSLNWPPGVGRTSRGFLKKYQTEFKLEVGKSFLAGEGGTKLLAPQWSLPEEEVRIWGSHYRLHGIDGLQGLSPVQYRLKSTV